MAMRFPSFRDPWGMRQQLEQRPYAILAGAVGLGFVLGGGLFTRLTAKIVGMGFRAGALAALPLVQKELLRRVIDGEGHPAEQAPQDVSHVGA